MANLQEVVSFLDQELNIGEIPDYAGALNGLQIENGGTVTKVAAAVDASLPVFEKAAEAGADLLLVHHGMFWQGGAKGDGGCLQKNEDGHRSWTGTLQCAYTSRCASCFW